jgi:hypothetical protein
MSNIITITWIIANRHIDIKYSIPVDRECYTYLESIKDLFKSKFTNEKEIWKDYKYVHTFKIELSPDKIEKELASNFDWVCKDAKKIYERRNED